MVEVELGELPGNLEKTYEGMYQGQKAPRLPKILKI